MSIGKTDLNQYFLCKVFKTRVISVFYRRKKNFVYTLLSPFQFILIFIYFIFSIIMITIIIICVHDMQLQLGIFIMNNLKIITVTI